MTHVRRSLAEFEGPEAGFGSPTGDFPTSLVRSCSPGSATNEVALKRLSKMESKSDFVVFITGDSASGAGGGGEALTVGQQKGGMEE